jgi:hypothetical protein
MARATIFNVVVKRRWKGVTTGARGEGRVVRWILRKSVPERMNGRRRSGSGSSKFGNHSAPSVASAGSI